MLLPSTQSTESLVCAVPKVLIYAQLQQHSIIAPSQAEKRLELQEAELSSGHRTGDIAWLTDGLNIEELQYGFVLYIFQ